jgi:type II secretory pathway pseudopilin PulG
MYWLARNSAALQSIATICGVVLAAITILVLVATWKAIRRQAEAAEDQAAAARAQTQAAKDAAESARKQSDLLLAQIEQSTAPLLVAEPDDRDGFRNCKLVNRGAGVAFQIFYWQGDLDAPKDGRTVSHSVRPSTLGAGNFVYLPIPPAWPVFTVRYKGVDREERWTVVYQDPVKDQHHWVRKAGTVFSIT